MEELEKNRRQHSGSWRKHWFCIERAGFKSCFLKDEYLWISLVAAFMLCFLISRMRTSNANLR